MAIVPARTLIDALEAKLKAITIADDSDEPLFEVVERYGNKSLGQALVDLTITKGRVCLIVPEGTHRLNDDFASHRVLTKRFLRVDLLIADRAFYKAAQVAVFGGEKNLGVIEMGERVEVKMEGVDLSDYGPAIFEDSSQQTVANAEKDAPGRETFIQALLIPSGNTEALCS